MTYRIVGDRPKLKGRYACGLSVVESAFRDDSSLHRAYWQVDLANDDRLPIIAAKVDFEAEVVWDVRNAADTAEDYLWSCSQHGYGECEHAKVARAAIPEAVRQIIGPIHQYRILESQGAFDQ